jgi:dihydropyrimidinase
MVGINIGVPASMAWFPFNGWDDSFFGDLHMQGREGVQFFTQLKVTTSRWFSYGEGSIWATSSYEHTVSLLIKNGEIVTAESQYFADIYCEGETITRIAPSIDDVQADEVIDARGKYVFPGFIDPHVHIYLPFMGTLAKDTHETASRAALVGGTTTFIEMICPARNEKPLEAFEFWLGKARGNSACDFTFHMGVTRYDEEAESDFREIVGRGLSSFKVFLAYKGAFGVTDEELYKTLELAKKLGVITTAHCENADLVLELQKKLLAARKTGPEYHYWSRPPLVEAEGVHHLMTFAEMTGAHVYTVHTSCEESVREALVGKQRGVNVWIETLIQYLLLDRTDAEKPNFEGAKNVMSPPLRDKKNQPFLWDGLRDGSIATLATDHAPFDFDAQKRMGEGDFTRIPNGIPSLENRVDLYFTHGVKGGASACRGSSTRRAPRRRRFSDCSRAKARSRSGAMPIWSSTIRSIAARSQRRRT